MSGDRPLVAFNCTAYDDLPSGARARTAGLAAGALDEGAHVVLYTARGGSLRDDVLPEVEGEHDDAARRLHEIETPLDPGAPVLRAARSERWFRRHLARGADLFVTDYYPVVDDVRTAVTVHDLRYLTAPGDEPRSRVIWFRSMYPRLLRRAPHVVVPSAAVGAEVVRHVGVDVERVRVVPNAPSRSWRTAPLAEGDGSYLLWVGTPERRKRLAFLLRAYAIASDEGPLRPLVLVGRGGDAAHLPELGRRLAEAGLVVPRGIVPERALVELVRGAAALLHPSRYEGFGLPVVEALAVGTPVFAAAVPAVAEAARGGAHLLPSDRLAAWVGALVAFGRPDAAPERPPPAVVARIRAAGWRDAARSLLAVLPGRRGPGSVSG